MVEDCIRKIVGSRRSDEDANIKYIARIVEELEHFNFKQGDIYLVTYPKCGTHWMKYILWGILHKGEEPQGLKEMELEQYFFTEPERVGTKIFETMKSPRTFRTHLPSDLVPYSAQAKYIHVTRNPLDCCLSFYNFEKACVPEIYEGVTLDHFFDEFMKGDVLGGDYFQHVLGWYKHKNDDNYLHITYEEMSKDHRGSILKVAKFLGEDYYREISNDEELLGKIQYYSSFAFMKSLPKMHWPKQDVKVDIIEMAMAEKDPISDEDRYFNIEVMNKGQVGLSKSAFSEPQQQKMRKKLKEEFENTELLPQRE